MDKHLDVTTGVKQSIQGTKGKKLNNLNLV